MHVSLTRKQGKISACAAASVASFLLKELITMTVHPLDYVGKLTLDQLSRIEKVREAAKVFYESISDNCPGSREKSLAFTNIEEAAMWANKAISHNELK